MGGGEYESSLNLLSDALQKNNELQNSDLLMFAISLSCAGIGLYESAYAAADSAKTIFFKSLNAEQQKFVTDYLAQLYTQTPRGQEEARTKKLKEQKEAEAKSLREKVTIESFDTNTGKLRRPTSQLEISPETKPYDKDFYFIGKNEKRYERMCNGWYRGEHSNWYPIHDDLYEDGALERYVLRGWLPEKPFITKQDYISTFGSCFAIYMRNFLTKRGYKVGTPKGLDEKDLNKTYVLFYSEGLNNTFALCQQFEWAYENKHFSENLWYGSKQKLAAYNEEIRLNTKFIFDETNVFIMTLGVSEVWYSKKTDEVFWRSIPQDHFDPSIHGFRVSTVEENLRNLEKIYSLVRARHAKVPIIFSLSPVPLIVTYRPVSAITASTVSKAILRVAIDELCRRHEDDKNLFYFPSYEIVKEFVPDSMDWDNRHPKVEVVESVLNTFAKYYIVQE